MKYLLLLILGLYMRIPAPAQQDLAEQLRDRYAIKNGFEATITIRIEVPGITAPLKTIEVNYKKGKSPKIKGAGLILLPKKGFVDQFSELLTPRVQWIHLETGGDFQSFKLVELDPSSDWITADIKVNMKELRIEDVDLATRESGSFQIHHVYGSGKYPDRSEISFDTDKFSIPLKILGKSDSSAKKSSTGKVKGKIIVEFIRLNVF
ncbi:MAG: hypothetical protein NT040_02220 [Bacteroidetes bacterium]|nr:hypothetical protein [Bacteroidota bacterium]